MTDPDLAARDQANSDVAARRGRAATPSDDGERVAEPGDLDLGGTGGRRTADDGVRDDRVRDDRVRDDQIRGDRVGDDRVRDDQIRDDQIRDDQIRDDQIRDDQIRNGRVPGGGGVRDDYAGDGRVADGRVADGRVGDGRTADDRVVDDRVVDGQVADDRFVNSQTADGRFADGRLTEDRVDEGRAGTVVERPATDVVEEPTTVVRPRTSGAAVFGALLATIGLCGALTGLLAPEAFVVAIIAGLVCLGALAGVARRPIAGGGLATVGLIISVAAVVIAVLAMTKQFTWPNSSVDEISRWHAWLVDHWSWLGRWT